MPEVSTESSATWHYVFVVMEIFADAAVLETVFPPLLLLLDTKSYTLPSSFAYLRRNSNSWGFNSYSAKIRDQISGRLAWGGSSVMYGV